MIKPKLISLLKTTLGNQRVYGKVPDESAVKPCFHVYELANRSIRDTSGDKAGSSAVWRLVTYVKDESTLPVASVADTAVVDPL